MLYIAFHLLTFVSFVDVLQMFQSTRKKSKARFKLSSQEAQALAKQIVDIHEVTAKRAWYLTCNAVIYACALCHPTYGYNSISSTHAYTQLKQQTKEKMSVIEHGMWSQVCTRESE